MSDHFDKEELRDIGYTLAQEAFLKSHTRLILHLTILLKQVCDISETDAHQIARDAARRVVEGYSEETLERAEQIDCEVYSTRQ